PRLGLFVELANAAVPADPPQTAQRVLGTLELVVLGSDPDGGRIIRGLAGGGPAHRVDGHLVDLDAERLVLLERVAGRPLRGGIPLLGIGSGWRGVPVSASSDIDLCLLAGDGPELAPVALLPGVALADGAAHLVPPDARRFTPGKWAGRSGEALAVGLELLQQLVVIAGDRKVVGGEHVHVLGGVPALGGLAGGVPVGVPLG